MDSANKNEAVILVRAAEALVAISPDNAPRAARKVAPFVKRSIAGEEDTRMRACLLLAKLGPPAYSALIDMLTWREPKVDRKIDGDPVELRAKRAAARALASADPLPAEAKLPLKRLVAHPDPVISYLAARALRAGP